MTNDQLDAARAMLAVLQAIQGCPQAMPWLARLPADNSIMSVADTMAIAIAMATAAGIAPKAGR